MTFGARLRERREDKKLTQGQLGLGLGTDGKDASKAVVYGWEKDQHYPRVDQLVLICQRLGCSADYLLFGIERGEALRPEVAKVASEIDKLPEKQRDWLMSVIAQSLSLARESMGVTASSVKRDTELDTEQTKPPLRRVNGT